jgi:hypothetical protein
MRCGLRWDQITRIARYALLPIVLTSVLPTAAFAQLVCHSIRRNESAAQVARRITGDGRNAYQAWFQIMNASSRFVPKSQYDRIRAGWQACVTKPARLRESAPAFQAHIASSQAMPVKPSGAADAPASAVSVGTSDARAAHAVFAPPAALATSDVIADSGVPSSAVASHVVRAIGSVDLIMVWLGAALAVPWFGWRFVDDYLARRNTTSIVIRYFADRFVLEFERPLVRYSDADRPLRCRLRSRARPGRFDILLAPGEGRRYPNLSDHKKNVEYDVARVVRVLGDESFVSGPLYMRAGWVVVPFRFLDHRSVGGSGKAGPKQAGVTCISSL